ncbi:MAG: dCTP deaminase [Candidatus Vogelbacteria bacterium]|nr:dCTP deaminase [Candidatus Vogelbacteria bacterium]
MILAKNKIIEELKNGNIVIEPIPTDDQIGPGSVDLHLDKAFRIFKHYNEVFPVTNDANFETITEKIEIEEGGYLLLKPGESVLGITKETITLSPSLAGWIEGRSRFARIGLGVHITSGFAQPGINNKQVLEITNMGPAPMALYPGIRLCQFIFERCDGTAQYKGKFSHQREP